MTTCEVKFDHLSDEVYSLAGKQLKFNTKEDIEPYVNEIIDKKNLSKIDLSGNTLGIAASESLAQAIRKHKDTLLEVDFSDLYTGRLNTEIPLSLNFLLPALLECTKLKIVNLSDNAFGLQTIEPIEDYLAKAITVEHLILTNNGMGPFAGARIGKSLYNLAKAKKRKAYPSLKTFVCGRNRLENGSMDYLLIALKNHLDLEIVRLYQNGIRPAGINKLIKFGLRKNSKLKVVDLQDNTLTTKASVALAQALQDWDELEELNVNDCLLKPEGSLAVTKSLAENEKQTLKTLKLQYNELDPKGLAYLSSAVKFKLPNLKSLELNGNRFDEDDEFLAQIVEEFDNRGFGEVDELDDLEELDSEDETDEDETDDADAEDDDEIEAYLESLEKEFENKVSENDKDVDDIAEELKQTHIA